MAIRTIDDLKSSLTTILGDTPSDEGLSLLEDFADTMGSLTGDGSAEYWKKKCEDTDKNWRKRYTERFNAPVDNHDNDKPADKNTDKPRTFESLFKEE